MYTTLAGALCIGRCALCMDYEEDAGAAESRGRELTGDEDTVRFKGVGRQLRQVGRANAPWSHTAEEATAPVGVLPA